ncbi:Dyp-type peroxidase [Facilibium subflavum]|uniref:Dyp-type peroxidase n=1 Tax=Facilibium subflavum TaxID=2219058 RepID=UPI000E648820|nr:Dyp-type peroxidase [Facilibium subflavum]
MLDALQMIRYQKGIMADLPASAIYLFFQLEDKTHLKESLQVLQKLIDGESAVLGLGEQIMQKSSQKMPYHPYMPKGNQKKLAPAWRCDLVLWLRNSDQGTLMHQARQIIKALKDAFSCIDITRACTYEASYKEDLMVSHDLSGFEDGTENPKQDDRYNVAIIDDKKKYLHGGSCWAVQKWVHDFDWLDKASLQAKEAAIGRSLSDNRELENAPDSAHVKRTEQESFDPEAFMWRRSMPWIDDKLQGGLMFSCFARSFYPFEVQFNRMTGEDDGVVDGVFKFSKIKHTTFLWCPPFFKGKLDLSFLSL